MEINKQLFDDVLSGKLKGMFVLRNGCKIKSSELFRIRTANNHRIVLNGHYYTYSGRFFVLLTHSYPLDIIDFIPDTDMKENELKIEIPDGKIVDWEESKKQNKVVLKDKLLTYEDVCNKLQDMIDVALYDTPAEDGNALVADKYQLECLLAKNKLANVAKYLNNGWKPDFSDRLRVFVIYNEDDNTLKIEDQNSLYARDMGHTIFKSKELAQQAIEILGEETVKLAIKPLGV